MLPVMVCGEIVVSPVFRKVLKGYQRPAIPVTSLGVGGGLRGRILMAVAGESSVEGIGLPPGSKGAQRGLDPSVGRCMYPTAPHRSALAAVIEQHFPGTSQRSDQAMLGS
jgi:hypothetical protein